MHLPSFLKNNLKKKPVIITLGVLCGIAGIGIIYGGLQFFRQPLFCGGKNQPLCSSATVGTKRGCKPPYVFNTDRTECVICPSNTYYDGKGECLMCGLDGGKACVTDTEITINGCREPYVNKDGACVECPPGSDFNRKKGTCYFY